MTAISEKGKERKGAGPGRHRYFLNELTLSWHDVIASLCNIIIILLHVTKARELLKKNVIPRFILVNNVTLSQS